MNKNKLKNRLKYWNIIILCFVLVCLVESGNVLITSAAPSSYSISDYAHTATPEDTTTPTPENPTPTITPSTPTPTPIPPAPTPTPIPQPTSPPFIPPPLPTDDAVATATPTSTATATPTAVPIVPTSAPKTTNTGPSNPGSGNDGGGLNPLGLSLSIGISAILLFGGGFFWFYSRRNQQAVAGSSWATGSAATTNAPWTSSSDMALNTLGANNSGMAASTPWTSSSGMVTNTPWADNSDMPTSNVSSVPLGAFDSPHNVTQYMEPEHMLGGPAPVTPASQFPMIEINSFAAMPSLAAAETPSPQLPDVAVDPMLAKVMREAQIGLFATLDHDKI